jgi:hypothetical protein
MNRNKLPSHGDMVTAIVGYYDSASPAQRADGQAWYPLAQGIVEAIGKATNTDVVKVAYALAALSPRNPWRWNVADCYSYCAARRAGLTMPKATTFKRNQVAAWTALGQDGQPWLSAAPKVNAFVAAIMGNPLSVVVDVWAVKAATHGLADYVGTDKRYLAVAAAYTEAAALRGVLPRDMQAIVWLVVQTEGLASSRTGRHDKAFKAGTHPLVVELLSGQQAAGL